VFSSACSVDAESVPEPNPARCIDGASSTSTTSSLSSPSPGRSLQLGHPLGSAQVPLDAAVAGRKVTVAFSPADFPLLHCDLFSMSWHNPTALGCQLLLPVAASLPSGRVAPPRLDWLAASRWRGDQVSPTTFYPCEPWRSSPDALYVYRHEQEDPEEATPSLRRRAAQARNFNGSPPPVLRPRRNTASPQRLPLFEHRPFR
jgi:hypothetical protein